MSASPSVWLHTDAQRYHPNHPPLVLQSQGSHWQNQQRTAFCPGISRSQHHRAVELITLTYQIAIHKTSVPGVKSIGEFLYTQIRMHIRSHRRFQQGQVDAVAQDIHPIFAVVEHGTSLIPLCESCPFLVSDLKSVSIKGA